jgi:hypothetical protein
MRFFRPDVCSVAVPVALMAVEVARCQTSVSQGLALRTLDHDLLVCFLVKTYFIT